MRSLSEQEARIADALAKQGLEREDCEAFACMYLKIDWDKLLLTRREMAEITGVPIATISYHATRIDSGQDFRPLVRKRGVDGRPSQSLFLAPISVPAFMSLAEHPEQEAKGDAAGG